MFESQLESLIQDKVCAEVRKQVGAHSSAAGQPAPPAEPGPPCRAPAPGRPEAVLEHVTARERRRLASHLRAKALESKAGLIPQRVQLSSQKCRRHPGGGLSPGHGGGRLRPSGWSPGPRGERLLSGCGTVAAEVGPERSAQGAASLAGCRPRLPGSDSPGGEKVLTRSITPLPGRASSVPFADERPLSCVLQKFSTEEREKLLTHFSVRTLEIRMKSLPRMARESHAMAGAQGRRSPLAKCAHPALRAPKRRKRIVLLFEEKSLHQIDLDLQFKYQRFLLGLPVARMFPKSKALPKCLPESSPAARGKPAGRRAEGGRLRVRAQVLGRHVSFKKSLPELASAIRKVLEAAPVRASDPGPRGVARQGEGHPRTFWAPPCPRGTVQQDTTVPPEAKSSVTPEREKKCRVWFQEAEACQPSDSRLPAGAPRSAGPCSSPTSEDASEGLKDAENWAEAQERPSREGGAGEESLFWEVTRYFRREAGHTLCGGQRGSWQGLPEAEKMQTSPPSEACPSQHTGSSGGHPPSGTPPSRGSRQSKKSRVSPQSDGAPRGLCGGALSPANGGPVPSGASSCSSSDATSGKTGRSLFASTESKVKLHPAKSQGRLHRGAERRERQRPTLDSPGKSSTRACAPRWAPSDLGDQPHPGRRPQDGGEEPPERGARPPSRQKLARPTRSEEASPPAERSRGPPFFYACVPADSLEVTPKTVRWAIPPKALKKRNFRLPLVAKVSSSSDLCSSSKHLLEAFLGSFSLVPPDWGHARGTRRPAGSAGLFSDE
ncbi:leucine-rich repeat transmembrane protein CCDC168-like [Talpa occidentalis]|uniref:leucine-rich repeat transmembrane protein CCDC168-like n=1 Tax=Talpa occidentalis TaxID=50954 RepID=UPI00188E2B2C|nr:leucine-rich repeat transmembrane protein CCDC168-like [Talpa occidentalis]